MEGIAVHKILLTSSTFCLLTFAFIACPEDDQGYTACGEFDDCIPARTARSASAARAA